ncbi:hypothetical protein IAG44_15775 [Streptomyces roseirectus]|uniref:Uncharacterized protein n=1 Tax=Streptomyces roseirectus TaxID=2768066 RepID=A0A7H0ID82_9ACTN|nr:hypothetical protein [Streptomyces roseirectus]QNP70748.1 hypothetical protein IAG44_15775 [Streptomyces roseirectus]
MSYGQGGPQSQWDPWKPNSQQPWNSESGGGTASPDWAALAEASESRNKRKRIFLIGGGAVATLAIGTAVAMAVVSANDTGTANNPTSSLPAAGDLPSASSTPSFAPTTAPPPLNPKEFISDKAKDTAPNGPHLLFPGTQVTLGSGLYRKGPSSDTTNCASVAQGSLPKVLTADGCTRLIRVTYVKDKIATTVGVAVFDTEAKALKAKQDADDKSFVKPLSGNGIGAFCNGAVCRSTTNSYGRYAYFTVSGFTDGKNVTKTDTAVFKAGDDLAELAFQQINRRGETQASAAAEAP